MCHLIVLTLMQILFLIVEQTGAIPAISMDRAIQLNYKDYQQNERLGGVISHYLTIAINTITVD